MNAIGSAIPSCHSDIRVFTTKAILRTGIWGETLELQRSGSARLRKVRSVAPMRVWDQFLNVRAGRTVNPSPPEVGLRMARLWDAIRESTARGGAVISLPAAPPPDYPTWPLWFVGFAFVHTRRAGGLLTLGLLLNALVPIALPWV